jgi:DNA-binding CsgD family transcriptional regulator
MLERARIADLSSSIAKTGSRNRVEALRIAEQSGWL